MSGDRSADVEEEMYSLTQRDEFFQSEVVDKSHVQTLAHLSHTRGVASLFSSADQTEEVFAQHAEAIRLLDSLASAVKTTAVELVQSIKAVQKAKDLEQKEHEKEQKRLEAKQKRQEELEVKKKERELEKQRQADEAAAAASAEQMDGGGDDRKKRRASAKLTAELTDTDPTILKEKFPNRQIAVFDSVDT